MGKASKAVKSSTTPNAPTEKKKFSQDDKIENVRIVHGLLAQFAADKDFHEDLKLAIVKSALNHWCAYYSYSYFSETS